MSRANVAKSRADKAGKTTSAPTPAVTHEIVPGKCNDQDWNLMLDHDDGDDFVLEIVEEVVESAVDIIYKNYLDSQLIPYTVTQAKDALLQIIEWQYLSSDLGEPNLEEDNSWLEDEEPEPAMTDCWAQGSVPRIRAPITPRTDELEDISEENDERHGTPVSEQAENSVEGDEESEAGGSSESSGQTSSRSSEDEPREPTKDTKKDYKRRNVKFRPYRGKLKSAGVSNITESLEETEMIQMFYDMTPVPPKTPDTVILQMPNSCHSIVKSVYEDTLTSSSPRLAPLQYTPTDNNNHVTKLQTGRPPGIRDVVYDEAGNVIAVTKVNPHKLPTHRIKTGFQVIDPQVEASQARLESMRIGRRTQRPSVKSKKTSPRVVNLVAEKKSGSDVKVPPGTLPMGRVRDGVTPLPPPLIEVMDVAPGVVVKEGDRIKKGPKQHPRRAELIAHAANRALYPVRGKATLPTVMVTEIIGHTSPIIKPLGEARPIPPISPQC